MKTLIASLKRDCAAMHWTEQAELALLAAALLAIPFNSGVSLVFLCLWMINVAIKNTILKRWSFLGWHQDKTYTYRHEAYMLIPMLCYWLVYLISMCWTENLEYGWAELGQLIWFLILPLVCFSTDFRQIKKEHLRLMLWLYVLELTGLFLVLMGKIIYLYKPGESSFIWFLMCSDFYGIHHAYMALYLLAALAFLYGEVAHYLKQGINRFQAILIVCCALCLILFVICIKSRAGWLGLLLLLSLCWLHLLIVLKKYRFGAISLVLAIMLLLGVHWTLPDHFRTLSGTISQVVSGDTSDGRFTIMGNAWTVVKDNMVIGVGAGDRMDVLRPFYVTEDNPNETGYCPHNQFLDSWMTAGIPGLLALIAMLLVPMISAWRHKQFPFLAYILLFSLGILFESVLERQMGIVFFCVIMLWHVIDSEALSHALILEDK